MVDLPLFTQHVMQRHSRSIARADVAKLINHLTAGSISLASLRLLHERHASTSAT